MPICADKPLSDLMVAYCSLAYMCHSVRMSLTYVICFWQCVVSVLCVISSSTCAQQGQMTETDDLKLNPDITSNQLLHWVDML